MLDNLAVANLRSYPLRCTAAGWDESAKCPSQRHNCDMLGAGIKLAILRLLFGALTNSVTQQLEILVIYQKKMYSAKFRVLKYLAESFEKYFQQQYYTKRV